MPHEFTEWPYEPETQPSAQMGRRPPGRFTAVGLLDPGESLPSAGRKPLTTAEIIQLTAILIGGSGAAALIGYLIWALAVK
ncbi:MAG: hypothetical protein WA020_06750 [Candidatus Acidiferrales bacterium]